MKDFFALILKSVLPILFPISPLAVNFGREKAFFWHLIYGMFRFLVETRFKLPLRLLPYWLLALFKQMYILNINNLKLKKTRKLHEKIIQKNLLVYLKLHFHS